MTDGNNKEDGFSVAYCAGRVGIVLAVFGVVCAVLYYADVEQPFWVGVAGMVLAFTGFYALVAVWFLVRTFKTLNVLSLAVSAALAVFFSIRSIIIPVVRRAPETPFGAALLAALIHTPAAPIFLVVSAALVVALARPAKP